MDIHIETRATRITVKCAGRLDVASAKEFENRVEPLVRQSAQQIVLDFSHLQYISSAGIRSLLFLMKTAAARPTAGQSHNMLPLRLIQAGPAVRQVLELSGLLENLSTGYKPTPGKPPATGRTCAELLPVLRSTFPSPVSNAEADKQFVASVADGLEQIDKLKTDRPYLGRREPIDYNEARLQQVPEHMSGVADTVANIAEYMQGLISCIEKARQAVSY